MRGCFQAGFFQALLLLSGVVFQNEVFSSRVVLLMGFLFMVCRRGWVVYFCAGAGAAEAAGNFTPGELAR